MLPHLTRLLGWVIFIIFARLVSTLDPAAWVSRFLAPWYNFLTRLTVSFICCVLQVRLVPRHREAYAATLARCVASTLGAQAPGPGAVPVTAASGAPPSSSPQGSPYEEQRNWLRGLACGALHSCAAYGLRSIPSRSISYLLIPALNVKLKVKL